jgi:hypothetical protein
MALEMNAAHAVIVLDTADHGLDGGSASRVATDGLGDTADSPGNPNLEPVLMVVAAIALVAIDAQTATPVSSSRSAKTGPSVWPS